MKIAVVGEGLNSIVASSIFASVGNDVYVNSINNFNDSYLAEPGLHRLYTEQLSKGRLKAFGGESFNSNSIQFNNQQVNNQQVNNGQTNHEQANSEQAENDIEIIVLAEEGQSESIEKIIQCFNFSIKNNAVFIVLSPSFIGESESLEKKLNQLKINNKVCCIPLLIREGSAINDFSRPDRIVVGCDDLDAMEKIKSLFYPFNRVKNVMKVVHPREAEFSSFAGNAMLATRLSFMNEMANLAERLAVDIDVIRECIGSDPRIGKDYLYPGCGFGGNALDKNIDRVAKELQTQTDDLGLLEIVSKINKRQKDLLFRKIWTFFKTDIKGKHIAIWGGSFKPGTASIDRSPAIKLIESLLAQSASVAIYDPLANENLMKTFGNHITVYNNVYDVLVDADVLAICTEWKEFWSPDFERVRDTLKYKAIFDGRNLYNPLQLKELGLKYFGIGKGIASE